MMSGLAFTNGHITTTTTSEKSQNKTKYILRKEREKIKERGKTMFYPFYEPMINVPDIPALKSSKHLTLSVQKGHTDGH